jgi:hypothetical protein
MDTAMATFALGFIMNPKNPRRSLKLIDISINQYMDYWFRFLLAEDKVITLPVFVGEVVAWS